MKTFFYFKNSYGIKYLILCRNIKKELIPTQITKSKRIQIMSVLFNFFQAMSVHILYIKRYIKD